MHSKSSELASRPVFFEQNRVFRVYEGGALFADFFGDESTDGNQPEEWIASSVKALNRDSADPNEGLSTIRGEELKFAELLKLEPELMLGKGGNFEVLVKILDSAIRLPIQAHPDKAFSQKHFHSEHGKTEMWLVLATRPDARIYFGFDRRLTKEQFSKSIELTLTDKQALTGYLNEVKVKPGEVYLIPAKTVHAIGYGCLILEVQEPTDFTIQPEYWCGDYQLNHYEMYLGLPKETALDVFDFSIFGADCISLSRRAPKVKRSEAGVVLEDLIDHADTPCFSVKRVTLEKASHVIEEGRCVCIVVSGQGELREHSGTKSGQTLRKGDYFFMPDSTKGIYQLATGHSLQVVQCFPPANHS
jgi:mannose-6-phosphate isomerase